MPISFEELEGSPSGSFSDGKFTGRRMFAVDWADWTLFTAELYGSYRLTGGTVSFNNPATFPGVPQAVCTDIQFAPLPGDNPEKTSAITLTNGNAVTYDKAKITAIYKIPFSNSRVRGRGDLPGVPTGTYLDFNSDHGAEWVTVPGRVWKWSADSEPLGEDHNPGLLMPTEDITLTWSRVTSPPWNAIRDTKGKINSSQLMNYEVNKVLFVGARARKSFQLTEQTFWTLDYSFRVRAQDWNHRYRENPEGWAAIEDNGGGSPYAATSFDGLFQYG